MSNYSLAKCMAALFIFSLYVWLFGITGVVDGAEMIYADESKDFNPSLAEIRNNDAEVVVKPASKKIDDEPVTYYETSINAENYKKPDFADYPAQTTAPFYHGDPETLTETTSATAEDTSIPETAATTSETASATTVTSSDTTPNTIANTTAVTTTSDTSAPTSASTAETEPVSDDDLPEYETEEESGGIETEEAVEEPVETSDSPVESEILSVSIIGGKIVEGTALNIISRIVQNEIGSSFHKEAIKAQAVAAYTYVKLYNNNNLPAKNVNLSNEASERVKENVREVLGQLIYYDGEIIQALYGGSSAGYTASAKNVYGTDYPYLISKECPLDMRYDPNYGLAKSFTSNDIMTRVITETGIELTGDPSGWIKVLNRVDHVFTGEMTLGGKTSYTKNGNEIKINGRVFRENIMDFDIRSAAFDVSYDKNSDKFTFVTYGYGHGVGMSQNGANALAQYEGYDYKQILQFYYTGTEIY